jgi:hypothetical protein
MGFIREAGWPIYPIMLFGAGALLAAVRHALVPQRSLVPLIVGLCVATLTMGVLGTALGVQHSVIGLVDADPSLRWLLMVGMKEAMCCLDVSLLFVLVAALAGMTGSYRMATRIEHIAQRNA